MVYRKLQNLEALGSPLVGSPITYTIWTCYGNAADMISHDVWQSNGIMVSELAEDACLSRFRLVVWEMWNAW